VACALEYPSGGTGMTRAALKEISWEGRVMGTDACLIVITDEVWAGEEDLRRAEEDLHETERVLSRFREDSELSRLNREGRLVAGMRLLTAVWAAAGAHVLSGGLLDPRVIGSLEILGYRESLPHGEVEVARRPGSLPPVDDMGSWIDKATGSITLPPGTRLDLAGVGKALGIGWAALRLAGRHAGVLVDVGGDVVALGCDAQCKPWRIAVDHGEVVGQFEGSPLAVATSTTTLRAWKAGGKAAHHLIDPRTGEPSEGEFAYATVTAPTILEADLAAKHLILEGREAMRHFSEEELRAVVTDREGNTEYLGGPEGELERAWDRRGEAAG
jgi:thiamine biosynthesis lipoprotein